VHDVVVEVLVGDVGQESGAGRLELLEEGALGSDLGERLSIRRARDSDAHRARGTVARESDHTDVVAEVLSAELCSDTEPCVIRRTSASISRSR
jgi:hypothetical protein